MTRLGPMLLTVATLVATAAAFAVAERLKLEPSPIRRPSVTAAFSPVCRCRHRLARIAFTLRQGGSASVSIVDGGGAIVRRLDARRAGRRISAVWDGRNDAGTRAHDGVYRPRIDLGRRTIVMPNRILLDTRRPLVKLTLVSRREISPDGDRRGDFVSIRYALDEPAQASLLVGRRRFERRRGDATTGSFRWYGRVDGTLVPAGRYVLAVVAVDDAGNVSRPARATVTVRFVQLAQRTIRVRAGARFAVRVLTDARGVAWRLGRRKGRGHAGLLVLRAPAAPGRYLLTVSANGHAATAAVLVSPRRRP